MSGEDGSGDRTAIDRKGVRRQLKLALACGIVDAPIIQPALLACQVSCHRYGYKCHHCRSVYMVIVGTLVHQASRAEIQYPLRGLQRVGRGSSGGGQRWGL